MRKSWLTAGVIIVVVAGILTSSLLGQKTAGTVAHTVSRGYLGSSPRNTQAGLISMPDAETPIIVSSILSEIKKRDEELAQQEIIVQEEHQESDTEQPVEYGDDYTPQQLQDRQDAICYALSIQPWGEEGGTALLHLGGNESDWCWWKVNPDSGARGIPQNIDPPASWAYRESMYEQVDWMINYISSRYGTAQEAWAFWLSNGWY